MKAPQFIRYFLIVSSTLLFLILGFNLLIDPYEVTGKNLLKINQKLVRDGRVQKLNRIKELDHIDNLILGSSRSEKLNPDTVNRLLGGYTYTFGIGGANVEDALGLLLYLERENKLPKHVILCLDFTMFGAGKPAQSFYEIPELNFLGQHDTQQNYAAKLFSIDATRASMKTLKAHLKKTESDSYIGENGFVFSREQNTPGNIESIKKLAHQYYTVNYRSGEMTLSEERFGYLQRIVEISQKHEITLHVMLTPVHSHLFSMIQNNPKLARTLSQFKQTLKHITPYYDTMILSPETMNDNNFDDAVHYTEEMGDHFLKNLLNTPSN